MCAILFYCFKERIQYASYVHTKCNFVGQMGIYNEYVHAAQIQKPRDMW